jgi:ATP-dependent DNA helicase RecG
MTPKKVKKFILEGENDSIEFKTSFNNEVIETLVAFANTKGGNILIGINSANQIKGIQINPESTQNWVNEIKNKTLPSLLPDVEIVNIENKKIVVLTIQEYPVKPVSTRGKYFKRVNNSNHIMEISEIVNLHLKSFNTSWDFHINHEFNIEDISFEKAQRSIDTLNDSGTKISDDPYTFLVKNDLIRNGNLTNAAFLLFCEKDTAFTSIELGRFQTDTIIKDSHRTKSDILNQIDEVMNFVKKHINKEVIITESPRNTQKWQYPLEALREIIINMIVHRDYRSSSDSIVKIFDKKIEFYNPGRLPESININDLISNNYKSTPRNKLIADFCKSIGVIEKYGSGIQRVIKYFKEEGLPLPQFKNISEGFMVTVFTNEKINTSKNVPENVPENVLEKRLMGILNLIKQNNTTTIQKMAIILKVNVKTIKRDIQKLKDEGLIERIGPDKGGKWRTL